MRHLALLLACLLALPAMADVRAFPTAEGQGRGATGGRNASAIVIHVTTLVESTSDYCAPGATNGGTQANNWTDTGPLSNGATCSSDSDCGSETGACIEGALGGLQRALRSQSNRYIIPRVSGNLDMDGFGDLDTFYGNFTYLGHLGPSKTGTARGIYITGGETVIRGDGTDTGSADNFVIRYLSFHASSGDLSFFYDGTADCANIDAFRVWDSGDADGPDTWIADHIFATGSGDENIDVNRTHNFTVQKSVMGWPGWQMSECTGGANEFCQTDGTCSSTCDGEQLACTALNSLAKRSDGTFAKNAWLLAVARNPKASSTASGDHLSYINNFVYGGNESTYGTAIGSPSVRQTCSFWFDDATDPASYNVIGNYVRMGPECNAATRGYLAIADGAATGVPKLYLDDNIFDVGGGTHGTCNDTNEPCTLSPDDCATGTCEAFTGICAEGDGTTQRMMCVDNDDCGSGTSCVTPGCPESSPCGEVKTAIYDPDTITLESAAFGLSGGLVDGVTLWASGDVDENIVGTGTRDTGPNYPVEGAMLTRILDYGESGVLGDPWVCAGKCDAPASGANGCPDGEYSSVPQSVWRMGRPGTRVSELDVSDCTNATGSAHSDLVADTYYMGTCNSDGTTPCNCDDGEADTDGGSNGFCTSTADCSGQCDIENYADTDVDGINDTWETTHCADNDCDPNSTSECDNSNWTLNGTAGDTTSYPCIELYAYELLGEVTAPVGDPTAEGTTFDGASIN